MENQITFKYMVDFLNADRSRKIQLLKVYVSNFNGLKFSEINKIVDSTTNYFSKSLAKEMQRQRREIKVYGKLTLNRPVTKKIIIR